MPMITYALNHEDVLLARLFDPSHQGFYVDIGASDPLVSSVTRHFYESGWRGVNVEPTSTSRLLFEHRPRDVNLAVAVSDKAGSITFYEFGDWHPLSTCDAEQAQRTRQQTNLDYHARDVPVTTLADICRQHVHDGIDFLSVDVEGHERQVLSGGDWERYRPVAVVVEATLPNSQIPSHAGWEDVLTGAGYVYATFDGLNRYYIRREDERLVSRLHAPACVFDDYVPAEIIERRKQLEEQHRHLEALAKDAAWLRERLGEYENLGETALAVARRVHRAARRWPRLAGLVRRALGRAA